MIPEQRRRVEIIHESLLGKWPRLVHWQSQDAGGAVLREHLRQSAQMWEGRRRPDDLLWTGQAYREFTTWRAQYPGNLSPAEERFAVAMAARAERKKRRARWVFGSILVLATVTAGSMTLLWVRGEADRQRALRSEAAATQQARRAEAQKLLALAQIELERYSTGALAYALKSLELHDDAGARRFVLDILWRSPVARVLPLKAGGVTTPTFSSDGRWMAAVSAGADDFLIPYDGSSPAKLPNPNASGGNYVRFGGGDRFVVVASRTDPIGRVFSVPEGKLVRTLTGGLAVHARAEALWISERAANEIVWRSIPYEGGEGVAFARYRPESSARGGDVHPDEPSLAFLEGNTVRRRTLGFGEQSVETVWTPGFEPRYVRYLASGRHVMAVAQKGVEIYPLSGGADVRQLAFPASDAGVPIVASAGDTIAASDGQGTSDVRVWKLDDIPDAEPLVLRLQNTDVTRVALHPQSSWVAGAGNTGTIAFWPLQTKYSRVLPIAGAVSVQFSPDSLSLASCSDSQGVQLIALVSAKRTTKMTDDCTSLEFDRSGSRFLTAVWQSGVFLVKTSDGRRERLLDTGNDTALAAFDPAGRTVAIYRHDWTEPARRVIEILDLSTRTSRTLRVPDVTSDGAAKLPVLALAFGVDGALYTAGDGGLRRWDLEGGASELIQDEPAGTALMAFNRDRSRMLIAAGTKGLMMVERGSLMLLDLATRSRHAITSHGSNFIALAMSHDGSMIVTGDRSGTVRVGRATGEEPHLLIGHRKPVSGVAISPDGRWIASTDLAEIRIWPMPDLSRTPLHALPRVELLRTLERLTNVRAASVAASSTGYELQIGAFPGWKDLPAW